jgi:hypothetical protein
MKVYTHEEYMVKMKAQAAANPIVLNGKKMGMCIPGTIKGVERQEIDHKPVLVLYLREDSGEEYGVVMSRQMTDDLTNGLGPHPLVEEFFRLN